MTGEAFQDPEVRQARRELRYTRKRLQRLLEIGRLCFFEWTVNSDEISCSGDFERLYGLPPGTFDCTWNTWEGLIHPDDLPQVRQQIQTAVQKGEFLAEWRTSTPLAETKWIEGRGSVFPSSRHRSCLVGVLVDVTPRKLLEYDLNENNMFLERIMQSVSSAIFVLDLHHRIIKINDASLTITGIKCDELLYQPLDKLFNPRVQHDFRKKLAGLVEHHAPLTGFELPIVRPDSSERYVSLNVSPLLDNGQVTGTVVIVTDVTEQRTARERIRENEQRYRTIFDSANDAFFIHCAASGSILDVNGRAQEMYGYTRDEMCLLNVGDISGPGFDQERALTVMHRVAGGEPQLFEWLGRNRNGQTFWVEVNLKRVTLEGKDRLLAVVRDVTERKLATQALEENEEKFRTLADNIAQFAWMADPAGRIFWYNKRWLDYTGLTREDLAGEGWKKVQHPEHVERVEEKLTRCFREGSDWEDTMPLRSRTGEFRWFLSRAIPIRDAGGNVIRWFGTNTDVTEQLEAEQTLKMTMEELSRSNRELEQFAYIASHDLQEPLRMVTSYLRLLERKYKGALDDKADQYIDFAVDGAMRMHQLIEGLLTYSRISRSGSGFRAVDTNGVVDAATGNLRVQIEDSGGAVVREALPTVKGDSTLLLQLFQNLISNGLKYRKKGVRPYIHVSCRRVGREWEFAVRDNGIGIDRNHHDRIFQLFQRLHTREEFEGTGIGLASCKKIVERHGGRIWVDSAEGEGSTFFFTVPL